MQVHLSHFLHGQKFATHPAEIEFDKAHGWVEVDQDPVTQYNEPTPDPVAPDEQVKRTWSRRPKKELQNELLSR